jgi:hypothetical protein
MADADEDLVEAKDLEKGILRAIVRELMAYAQKKPATIRADINSFAREAGFEDLDGSDLALAKKWAVQGVDVAATALWMYIDEFPHIAPGERMDHISLLLLTREAFKTLYGFDYDDTPQPARVLMHCNLATFYVESNFIVSLDKELKGSDKKESAEGGVNEINYHADKYPAFLGLAFIHWRFREAMIRHTAEYTGTTPAILENVVNEARLNFTNDLSNPGAPVSSRELKLNQSWARQQMN